MNAPTESATSTGRYVLGHSQRELDRLKSQARVIDPITKCFFRDAGVAEGMRVLDVGSGAGDVAFLAADLVGPRGTVVGIDRVSAAIDEARRRVAARSMSNVTFHVGDPATFKFEAPFDAIVGRYVLQFQNDSAGMLRQLATHVRPGGLIVFHEIDWGGVGSFPTVPTYDRACGWGRDALRSHGTETRMGAKLYAAFVGAGLRPPTMRLQALVGGGPNATDILSLLAGVIDTLLPEIERLGVARAADVDIGTLVERIQKEVDDSRSIVIGHNQIFAWVRMQAA